MVENGFKKISDLEDRFPELANPPDVSVFTARFGDQSFSSGDMSSTRDRVEVFGDPQANQIYVLDCSDGVRRYAAPARNLTDAVNNAVLLCRSKYILLGDESGLETLRSEPGRMAVGSGGAFAVNRLVFERMGGLETQLDLGQAMSRYWDKIGQTFPGY
jgi:hypothetical protein